MELSYQKKELLTNILIDAGLIDDGENCSVLMSWERGDQQILLWSDGGDWENPACLFYRVYACDESLVEEIHIPESEYQYMLQEYNDEKTEHYQVLHEYVEKIIDQQDQWELIESFFEQEEK